MNGSNISAVGTGQRSDLHRWSMDDRDGFWSRQLELIEWNQVPTRICDESERPFVRWFPDGTTNLCHNAVDRHLADRADRPALIAVSTETGSERTYTYAELHREVQRMAAVLRELGVGRGDRVLIYMPMIAEAVFAMLGATRIGAIHSVVFGGFAAAALATRIDDASPTVIVSVDAGARAGRVIPYKPLLDEALRLSAHADARVLLVDRGLAPIERNRDRDVDWGEIGERHRDARVECVWLRADEVSYTLYTSGTTGKPKGVQRDTGGYAVALTASMRHLFGAEPGQVFFCTSDIGWVVGHSYIVYGPLLAGMATILYEGLPTQPDPGVWWRLVERHGVTHMFSAPTAIRVLRGYGSEHVRQNDISTLRGLWLAGEPLDAPTSRWIHETLGVPVTDNYWQTETGWPILTLPFASRETQGRLGSPGRAVYGYDVRLIDQATGRDIEAPNVKGVLAIEGPLPPGCLQTVWRNDERFVQTYWRSIPGREVYSTFDWGMRDEDGYYFILGRTDDVINVAGHRLGTREIEEIVLAHEGVVEALVVGVACEIKGQSVTAVVVPRDREAITDPAKADTLRREIVDAVARRLGAVAKPSSVMILSGLPKTRSGKLLRRAIQAVIEGRDAGDLSTLEDGAALSVLRDAISERQRDPRRA